MTDIISKIKLLTEILIAALVTPNFLFLVKQFLERKIISYQQILPLLGFPQGKDEFVFVNAFSKS